MKNWDKTYIKDEIKVDGYHATVSVWSAIIDHAFRAQGSLDWEIWSDNCVSTTRVCLTPNQMRQLAGKLEAHAARLDFLAIEVALMTDEAAA